MKPQVLFTRTVFIRFKQVRDTTNTCNKMKEPWRWYLEGYSPPHFGVPAVIVQADYMPASDDQPYPSAYWYVASYRLLWSCFQKWGLIEERA
jgi:hypothetical protein